MVACSSLENVYRKIGRDSVNRKCGEIYSARLQNGHIGKGCGNIHRGRKCAIVTRQSISHIANLARQFRRIVRYQYCASIQNPAVSFQGGIHGVKGQLFVVNLARFAPRSCVGAFHFSVNDIRVDNINGGQQVDPAGVANDCGLVCVGGFNH